MAAIRDLDGAGRAPRGAVGVDPGPVTADQLRSRPGGEPSGERVRRPLTQDVDRPAGLDVDQQRPVAVPLAQRELVHAQHLGDALTAGSGRARTSRSSVIRLTAAANRPDRRAPARPPSAKATASSTAVTAEVRSACLAVSPLTCSANAFLPHCGVRHANRRTAGGSPPRSRRRRCPATAAHAGCGPGQTPPGIRGRWPSAPSSWRRPGSGSRSGKPFYLHLRQGRQQHLRSIKTAQRTCSQKPHLAPYATRRIGSRKVSQSPNLDSLATGRFLLTVNTFP